LDHVEFVRSTPARDLATAPRPTVGRGGGERKGKAGGAAARGFDARSIARARANPQVTIRRYHRHVRIGLVVLGALVAFGGLVWIAQGLNLPFAREAS